MASHKPPTDTAHPVDGLHAHGGSPPPAVSYRRDGAIGVITLQRPDNRNSMTPELLDAFSAAAEMARHDADLRVLVVTGTGSCFSAGADFRSQIQRDDASARLPHEQSFAMYRPFLQLLDLEVPILGALNGHAVGGGFGLALLCDLRIGSEAARYGANFVRIGLSPGMAISYLLPRVVGAQRATEMLLTGRLLLGAEAIQAGLLLEALPAAEVLPRTMELAATIAGNAPLAVRATRRMIAEGLGWDPRAAARREAYAQAETVATQDAREGMAALLEKRTPAFVGR